MLNRLISLSTLSLPPSPAPSLTRFLSNLHMSQKHARTRTRKDAKRQQRQHLYPNPQPLLRPRLGFGFKWDGLDAQVGQKILPFGTETIEKSKELGFVAEDELRGETTGRSGFTDGEVW
jgi:hypothetical protein